MEASTPALPLFISLPAQQRMASAAVTVIRMKKTCMLKFSEALASIIAAGM